MTLPMDIRIASSAARFGFVFARRGIVPEACSSWFLPRVVGISQALEWTYSGRVFPAEEALAGRLVSRVVAPDDAAARRLRAGARDRRQHVGRVDRAHPGDDVAHARRRPPDGSPPRRLARHPLDGPLTPTRARASRRSCEKRPPHFTMRPSADMPDFYPWWEERPFK